MLNIGETRYIYTDGGCHNEQGPKHGIGSWAFLEPVDLSQGYVDVYGGYTTDTTNNATEMLAIINGIKHIDDTSIDSHPSIHVVSDSEYVVKGYNDPAYLDRWVAKGWRTSSNKPVLNRDLWERILSLSWHIGLEFELIRGHSHDNNHIHAFWNNICDKSCTFIMDNLQYSGYRYNLRYDFDTRKILLSSQIIWEA
jgi:ribonuclease HI